MLIVIFYIYGQMANCSTFYVNLEKLQESSISYDDSSIKTGQKIWWIWIFLQVNSSWQACARKCIVLTLLTQGLSMAVIAMLFNVSTRFVVR